MIFLGFYLGHDSNVAISVDGRVRYRKSERHLGLKHHKADFSFVLEALSDWGISIKDVNYCAYSDGNRNGLGECRDDELVCEGRLEGVKNFCLDHHYAHTLSAWPIVDTESLRFGICIDGRGDNDRCMKIFENPSSNPRMIHEERGKGMGWEFYQIGNLLGFQGLEYDFAGKLMGLQSYSDESLAQFGLPRMTDLDTGHLKSRIEGGEYKSFSEWHDYWFNRTRIIFESFFGREDYICYTGGCAQNTVYNYRLKSLFPNLFIPPHCYDGGLSLGCLEFLRLRFGAEKMSTEGFPYWQDDEIKEKPNDSAIRKAAEMLSAGKILGWAQGRGELGPRALGNRSILMGADRAENKDILNLRVKKREPWRPYAGSVMAQYSLDYFDFHQESKHMLYACPVKSNDIPAITHVDGTCRMQTVEESDNPLFYSLISEYFKITGIPVILNTSLNVMGSPIASNEKQIKNLLKSNIDVIFVGDKILKKNIF